MVEALVCEPTELGLFGLQEIFAQKSNNFSSTKTFCQRHSNIRPKVSDRIEVFS